MIKQFQNLTLRAKLILIQVMTSGLLLFLFAAYYVVHEFQGYRIDSVNQLKTSSHILASNSVSSLHFLDAPAAEKVLSSLATQPNISNAWIHDASGQLFATYSRIEKQEALSQEDLINGEHFSGNFITYTREVTSDGITLGRLTMRLDASGRWESLVSNIAIAGLLLLIGLMLSYILSANTQKSISHPILRLAKTIQQVSDSGEYSIRVKESMEEEIGTLYRGFNGLMVQIAKREKERDAAEQALTESKKYVQNLFDSSLDMIVSVDQNRCIVQFNSAAQKTFGYKTDEIIGQPVEILYADPEYSRVIEKQITETGIFIGEISNKRKNGETFPSLISTALLYDEEGQIIGTVGNARDITEAKRVEKELEEQHQLLQLVIKTIPDIVFAKDIDHKFILGNQSFAERYGQDSPDGLIGKTDFDLYGEAEAKAFHAEEDLIFASNQPQINRQDSIIDREGNERWSLNSKYIIRNSQDKVMGLLGYSRDITELKTAELELQKHQNHLEELVRERTQDLEQARASLARAQEIAHLGSWEWDIVENTLIWSDEVYNIFDIKTAQFGNSHEALMSLIHPEDQTRVQEAIDASLNTGVPYGIDHRLVRPDNSQRTVYQQGEVLLDEQGKAIRMVGTVLDITEQHQIEEELKKAKEEAEAANLHLQELDKLKSMFIATMSHELRTPLNSIIGFTGMMLQGISGEINERQADNLQRVYQSGKHLLSLISDIIDISKIEAGRIDVFPQNISLGDLINEAVTTIQREAEKKGLTVTIMTSSWPEIESDRKRLLQCVLNLLSNAVKYSELGKIEVNITELEQDVEISVRDTGIGISESDIPILFEAFERLESPLRITSGGTGLGLYLTKKIVQELLNGEISVRSTLGEGSIFTLSVPRKLAKSSGSRSVNDE